MRRTMSPRTETLQRTYLGLLAVSIVLSGVLIDRHVAPPQSETAGMMAALTPAPSHGAASPLIKWGGQKR